MISITLSYDLLNKPVDPTAIAYANWNYKQVTPEQLLNHVSNGLAFCVGVPNRANLKKPKVADIIGSEIIGIDIDNDVKNEAYQTDKSQPKKRRKTEAEGYFTLEQAISDSFLQKYALFVYTTPSHMPEHHKFRVVFWTNEKIRDAYQYSQLVAELIKKYNSDIACKNIDRIYFGSDTTTSHVYNDFNNRLDISVLKTKKTNTEPENNNYHSDKTPSIEEIRNILSYIPGDMLEYSDWNRINLALINTYGLHTGVSLIDEWSPDIKVGTMAKYKGSHIRNLAIGTVIFEAKKYGYSTPAAYKPEPQNDFIRKDVETDKFKYFDRTDVGAAQRIIDSQQGKLLYNTTANAWCEWNGKVFEHMPKDSGGEREYITNLSYELQEYAATLENEEAKEAFDKYAYRLRSTNRDKIAKEMRSLRQSWVSAKELDADGDIINLNNGVYNLITGDLKPHAPEYFCTKIADVDYNPNADIKYFKEILDTVFCSNKELIDYIQRALGMTLIGTHTEEVFFFCHGGGANGKTLFFRIIQNVLQDYVYSTPEEMFTNRDFGDREKHLAEMVAKRMFLVSELSDSRHFNEAFLKKLVGGEEIDARAIYQNPFKFMPQGSLWIVGNYKPDIKGTDEGIWRRCQYVPFDAKILPSQRRPQEDILKDLEGEKEGILLWLLEGVKEYREKGLNPPKIILDAIAAYRNEQDKLLEFIEEELEVTGNQFDKMKASDIYNVFADYCKKNNIDYRVGKIKFRSQLEQREGFTKHIDRKGIIFFSGVKKRGALSIGNPEDDVPTF